MSDDRAPLREAPPLERRRGARDRRVVIPTDWAPDGRQYLERELRDIWSAIKDVSEPLDRLASAVERLQQTADRIEPMIQAWPRVAVRNGIMWALVVFLATGLAGTGFYLLNQRLASELTASAATARQERVEAIADILEDIPRDPALRLQSGPLRGAPTLAAVQARLPTVRGLTAADRDAACVLLEDRGRMGACRP